MIQNSRLKIDSSGGFSLIETMIAIGIGSLIIYAISVFMTDQSATTSESNRKKGSIDEARYLIGNINKFYLKSQSIEAKGKGIEIEIDGSKRTYASSCASGGISVKGNTARKACGVNCGGGNVPVVKVSGHESSRGRKQYPSNLAGKDRRDFGAMGLILCSVEEALLNSTEWL